MSVTGAMIMFFRAQIEQGGDQHQNSLVANAPRTPALVNSSPIRCYSIISEAASKPVIHPGHPDANEPEPQSSLRRRAKASASLIFADQFPLAETLGGACRYLAKMATRDIVVDNRLFLRIGRSIRGGAASPAAGGRPVKTAGASGSTGDNLGTSDTNPQAP